ncbi:MAG: metal-sensitive transcriptional regulator [Firmicutes bacterium]|nr:metal-sensitive transcriptional regulator [Bacillota bacterium]
MKEKEDIILRLKKIEGQIRGLQRIVNEERDCTDVITQLLAAGKALDKVTIMVASRSIKQCFSEDENSGESNEKKIESAVSLILKLAGHTNER